MISPARKICFDFLIKIESRRAFSDDVLNSDAVNTVDIRDRHLVTEIVYGTLRRQILLDYFLASAGSRPWMDVETGVKILLRMSLYQMWFMDRIPDHALVHDAVELGKKYVKKGAGRYINGILRHFSRRRPWNDARTLNHAPEWVRFSLPRWLWKRWIQRFGKDAAAAYAESLTMPPATTLRLGKRYDFGKLPFRVRESDIVPGAYVRTEKSIEKNTQSHECLPYQDEASQLIPHLMGDIDGWRVWDACAAPGGKTSILCGIAGDSGFIVASDRSGERIQHLKNAIKNIEGTKPEIVITDAERPAPFRRCFDAVFADVPCSGLGTLRRNPEIKWRLRSSDLPLLHKKQLSILGSVSENVRGGGRLLYSTCSTEPEENEQVVERFLETHPDFRISRPVSPSGISAWIGNDSMVRTFPSSRRWDGFFAALMVRRGGSYNGKRTEISAWNME